MPTIADGASVTVEVPASSANLGPGFDCLGLGLSIWDRVTATVEGSGLRVEIDGFGASDVPRDERHLIWRSMLEAWQRLGIDPPAGLTLLCRNEIPHSRGLGSSASGIVAGVALAVALHHGELTSAQLAVVNDIASDLEGHPDNASASVYGQFTTSWRDDSVGRWRTVALDPHPDVSPVVFLPNATLATEKARAVLPPAVPLVDAARNAGRAALLVHAITREPGLLLPATADWLHQEARRPAYGPSMELVDTLRAAGDAAFVSGAGPSVVCLTTEPQRVAGMNPGWTVLTPRVATRGVHLISHSRAETV